MDKKIELLKTYLNSLPIKKISFKTDMVFYIHSNNPYWVYRNINSEIYLNDDFVSEVSVLFNFNYDDLSLQIHKILLDKFLLTGNFKGIKKNHQKYISII